MSLAMKMLSGKIQLKFLLCISLFYFLHFYYKIFLFCPGQDNTRHRLLKPVIVGEEGMDCHRAAL